MALSEIRALLVWLLLQLGIVDKGQVGGRVAGRGRRLRGRVGSSWKGRAKGMSSRALSWY